MARSLFIAIVGCSLLLLSCAGLPGNLVISEQLHVPEGTLDSRDKRVQPQPQRVYAFAEREVWISTAFESGRLANARHVDEGFELHCRPENAPINNSPWYAFQIWGAARRNVTLRLRYFDGEHRYDPWVREEGGPWRRLPRANQRLISKTLLQLNLPISAKKTWIAAQPLLTTQQMTRWLAGLARGDDARLTEVGRTPQGRPIHRLTLGAPDKQRVIILGRIHPPELTGAFALVGFVEALAGSDPLARRFRERFTTLVFPVLNPDGVAAGHWRHNSRGVDLNRDWRHFRQPETRMMRDHLLPMKGQIAFAVDFHSTVEDVVYILDPKVAPRQHKRVEAWLVRYARALSNRRLSVQPITGSVPGAASWLTLALGAPAVTYELGDATPRTVVKEGARAAANALMAELLDGLRESSPR